MHIGELRWLTDGELLLKERIKLLLKIMKTCFLSCLPLNFAMVPSKCEAAMIRQSNLPNDAPFFA